MAAKSLGHEQSLIQLQSDFISTGSVDAASICEALLSDIRQDRPISEVVLFKLFCAGKQITSEELDGIISAVRGAMEPKIELNHDLFVNYSKVIALCARERGERRLAA